MGIPVSMFTVLFAIARTVGWVAQWNEMIEDPMQKIGRPRQLYTGSEHRHYVPMTKRGSPAISQYRRHRRRMGGSEPGLFRRRGGAVAAASAANDNKAPLRLKLRRLVVLVTAAAAIGWLFWAGMLR